MRIGLLGFEFDSPNKGCEALSYSFLGIIYDLLKNESVTIIYFSNYSLGNLPKIFPRFSYKIVPERLKDTHFTMIKEMRKCDYIFDVTMGDSFSDIYSRPYCLHLMRYKRIAELMCPKYVLLPQTYGPYSNDKVKKKALKIINKAYKVYARDRRSKEYVIQMGVQRQVDLSIDMAFSLPYDKRKYHIKEDGFNLGINVSGLLWKGGFNNSNQFNLTLDYKSYVIKLIEYYSNINEINIHLIPHVIDFSKNAHDDDYSVLKELNVKFPNVILAPAFINPIDAKSYISNMDCFIGARMHSTIAAFSSGVATIPVSYSRKFEGVFEDIGYQYLVHGTRNTTIEGFKNTIKYVSNYIELKNAIERKLHKINMESLSFKQDLLKLFTQ